MLTLSTTTGVFLDLLPNQDIAITLENPFFSADHIPIPWSTDIELPLSETNCSEFKYAPAMFIPPKNTTLQVVCHINGLSMMPGKLQVISYSNTSIKASLTGMDINDRLSGHLNNLPLAKWDFGKMTDNTRFWGLMQDAVFGRINEFEAPLLLRSNRLDYSQDAQHIIYGKHHSNAGSVNFAELREYWNSRYANFINPAQNYADSSKEEPWEKSGTPYLIPVVRLSYLLPFITNAEIFSDYKEYINKIGIIAPNKKNALLSDISHGGLDKDDNGNYILSLADALPKVEIATFTKEILNILSAALYLDNGRIIIISNNDVINGTDIIDWTDKLAYDYDCDITEGYKYHYGYQSMDDEVTEIDPTQIMIAGSYKAIYEYGMQPELDRSKGYTFQHKVTGDIYSVSYSGTIDGHPEFTLLQRGGIKANSTKKASTEDSDTTYNAKANIKLVKSIPAQFFLADIFTWDSVFMVAITDIPEIGSDPSEQIVIGILQDRQMVDKGVTLERRITAPDGNWLVEKEAMSLLIYEETPIYQKFHKAFAEFLATPKTEHKFTINLCASDISTLNIWRKRMFCNQIFYIKTLEITANTSTDYLHTEGTFIRG